MDGDPDTGQERRHGDDPRRRAERQGERLERERDRKEHTGDELTARPDSHGEEASRDGAEAARAEDPRPGTRRAAKTIPSLADGVAAEVEVETGLAYPDGEPVAVVAKRREHRYDLDDGGGAIARAGRPPGWEEAAERAVRRSG